MDAIQNNNNELPYYMIDPDYISMQYCIGFSTKKYIKVEKEEFIELLFQNKIHKEPICNLVDCGSDLHYHPFFDIDYYFKNTDFVFNLESSLNWIAEQFNVSVNDIALASDERENVKKSYHCV